MADTAPWDAPAAPDTPPWGAQPTEPPDDGGLIGTIKSIPGDIAALGTPQGRSAWAQVPGALAKGVYDSFKDFFTLPGDAMAGKVAPGDETARSVNFASLVVLSETWLGGLDRGMVGRQKVAKEFDDGITAPAAQRLDSFARAGDPNGVRLEPPNPAVQPAPIRPIEGSPFAGVPRSVAAKTGIPEVDSVLASPVTRAVIDNPVIDRSHDVPYMAGGSTPLNDPTVYIDRHVPKEQTVGGVTFDPAEPWAVHENVEQHTMELLTKGGMTDEEAYRVAHFQFAEPAEQAWYRAHGIDQVAAEKEQASWLPRIQHEPTDNPPPNLYDKPYPHANVRGAEHEAVAETPPTPDEIQRGMDIIRNAPELQPKSAVPMLAEARELGVIGMDAPENINLAELAARDKDTPAEAAFRAVPPQALGAQATPKEMMGQMGHAPGSYDARGKEWIDKIDSADDVRAAIEGMATQHDYYPEARAGKPSIASRAAVAEAAGIDPKEMDSGYFAEHFDNDGKVRAVIQALRQTAKDFVDASDRARKDPTDENAAAALEAEVRANHVLEYTMGKRAESGRSLNAWKDLLRETERSKATVELKKGEATGAVPTGVADLIGAAGETASKGTGLGKLINTARDLVDAQDKAPEVRKKLEGVAKRARSAAKETETGQRPTGFDALIAEAKELAETLPQAPKEIGKPEPQGLASMISEAQAAVRQTGAPGAAAKLISLAEQAEKLAMSMPRTAEEAAAKLPPDLASLVAEARKMSAGLAKTAPTKTALDKLVKGAEKQVADAVKQKTVKKPVDALPPELQGLVDKAERVVDRFGGTAKGEQAAFLLARAGRTAAEQAELARQVEGLTPNQVARVLARLRNNPKPGWYFWTVQQALISGLITHTKYALVNTVQTVFERVIAPEIAAVYDRARGGDKSLLAPIHAGTELIRAVPDALSGLRQAFKTGARVPLESELRLAERGEPNPESAGAQVPYGAQGGPDWGTFNPEKFWGRVLNATPEGLAKAERIIGTPGRSANAFHTFFKILNERAQNGMSAFEKAQAEGNKLGSDKFWDRYQYHLDNPSDEALRSNVEAGYSGTFMQKLGPRMQELSHWIRSTPAKWLVFFTHIPFNMVRSSIEYSPLALLNTLGETRMGSAIKGELGADAQNLAFAKMSVGTAVGAYFIHKALNGDATGDYPADPKERRRWQLEGIQPNSIKADGQWLSLERMGPQALIARIAANYAAVIQHYDGSQDEAMMKAGLAVVLGTAQVLSSDVGFETIANIINVMENPAEAARFAAWQVSSYLMPVSLVTQAASAMDPYMRQADTLLTGLKYHLPWLRETLLPKRDPLYGEPLPNPGYHAVFRESPVSTDPVKAELDRLKYYPTAPERTIGHVKLSDEQYDRYEATAGPLVKQMLSAAIQSPLYQNMKDAQRQAMVKGYIAYGRAKARAAMQMHNPELIQEGIAARQAQIAGR